MGLITPVKFEPNYQTDINSDPNFHFPYSNEDYFKDRYDRLSFVQCFELRYYLNQLESRYAEVNQLNSPLHKFMEKDLIRRFFVYVGV